jgi:hypothetical protein
MTGTGTKDKKLYMVRCRTTDKWASAPYRRIGDARARITVLRRSYEPKEYEIVIFTESAIEDYAGPSNRKR